MQSYIVDTRHYPRKSPLRITGHIFRATETVHVSIVREGVVAHGEAVGVFYLGETVESMQAQLESVRTQVEAGISREELAQALPPGGARNALDAALWDLEAKLSNKSIWQLTDISEREVFTVETVSIDKPEVMAAQALLIEGKQIKLKLDAETPVERVRAVREARPDAVIVVDANQGWTFEQLQAVAPALAELDVSMIEQPLPRGKDEALANYNSPVTLCADESCLDCSDLDQASNRYTMINIKLDKTGGLTEALRLAQRAREKNLGLMVGNMGGTSLVDAPGYVIAQLCDLVDMDGPLALAKDVEPSFSYDKGLVSGYSAERWG